MAEMRTVCALQNKTSAVLAEAAENSTVSTEETFADISFSEHSISVPFRSLLLLSGIFSLWRLFLCSDALLEGFKDFISVWIVDVL